LKNTILLNDIIMAWCWWEWGFKFSTIRDRVSKLPFVDSSKLEKLYYDIETKCCNPHDDRFENWGWLIAFLRANYIFALDTISLLHWTTVMWRLAIFLLLFIWTSTLGIKYFNWKG